MSVFNSFALADTIGAGTALGAGVLANNLEIIGLYMPAGWDAAAITLSMSQDGTTWSNVYDTSGNELTIQAAAGRYIPIGPAILPGAGFIRVRSGTSGTPVNQTAARTVTWLTRNYGR